MTLAWGYLAYLAATTIFSIVSAKLATRRALMSGSTHFEVCLIFAWYDFWIGGYYDRKLHRVFMFPVPMVGICVNCDAAPLGE